MNDVKFGHTGMEVSPICLGCMSFGSAGGWVHNRWALNEADSRTIGATKLAHLESAVQALAVKLSPQEVAYLEEPYIPHPLVGLIPYQSHS